MRLSVSAGEREVLLAELDGIVATSAALYRQIGREWDPGEPGAAPADVAPIVRLRDELAVGGPWTLTGTEAELSSLLGRLRAGAELALERGARPSPGAGAAPMHAGDRDGTDAQLDVLQVADALLRRLDSAS